jgi:glycosyltransferase involved in cell wall biosynthesis
MEPDISVIIPAHNEASWITRTIEAMAGACVTSARVEFVVVDDASTDGTAALLAHSSADIMRRWNVRIRIFRMQNRVGVPVARNWGATHASAEVLFITDAHVQPSSGWDRLVLENIRARRILAATVTQKGSGFHGYGCRLVVPSMGTYWNKEPVRALSEVQIAGCVGTAIPRDLFLQLGGYDSGMRLYGGAEPEFSIRAWLQGSEIMVVPWLMMQHRFKDQNERESFLAQTRPYMVHNSIRFGLLYLGDLGCLQLLRYFAARFPDHIERALQMIVSSDVWERRRFLEKRRERPFAWFVKRFGIKDEAGREILPGREILQGEELSCP